jgi:hypothetical protein
MWGGRRGAIPNMTDLVMHFQNKGKYGVDQTFLNEVVWPLIAHDQISHDAYNCRKDFSVTPEHVKFEYGRPFPTKRAGFQHVGQVFDARDQPRKGDIDFMRSQKTPLECRKVKEWDKG